MTKEREPRCPPGFFQIPGKSPDGLGNEWFLIPKDDFVGHIRSRSNRNKQLEGFIVPGTLDNPIGIWEGLERIDGKTAALAYVAKGSRFQGDISVELPPQPNKVFAVYVRESRAAGGQLIVDYWEHLPEDKTKRILVFQKTIRHGTGDDYGHQSERRDRRILQIPRRGT